MKTPWRPLALVIGAPMLVLALAGALWVQRTAVGARAAAAEARLAHALSQPAPLPEADALALLVPGATPGLAGSAVQAGLRAAIAASGAQVVEVAMGAPEPMGALTRLHLVLRLSGTEAQIVAALSGLERAVPVKAVDRLEIEASQAGLTARIEISAWSAGVEP